MTQTCYSAGCVESGRVAIVDSCTGEFVTDPNSQYVFGGVTAVTWEPQIENGETTTVKDMCGNICVRDLQCDQTVGYNVEITLCRPDNELVSLLTGEPAILDGGGDTIGYFQLDDSNCAPFVSLELFEKLPESACTSGVKYRRIIFPKIRITQSTPERQGPIRLLKLQGTAESGLGDGWGTGPAGDSPVDFASLMSANEKFYMSEVYDNVAPDPACGYVVNNPAPILTDTSSPDDCTILLDGSFDSDVDSVSFTFSSYGLVYFYSPTSVSFGANPPGTVINQWDATGIEIYLPDICGDCVNDVQFWYYDGGEVAFGPAIPISPCEQVLPLPTLTYDQEVMADSPEAWWLLNESSGPAVDSIAGDPLAETGSLTWNAGALRSGGDSVSGWSGSNHLDVVTPVTFTPSGTNPFTVEVIADIGPVNPAGVKTIYSYQGSSTGVYFYIDTAGKLVGRVGPTSPMFGTVALSLSTPHHIAVVGDGSDYQFYVDGVAYGPLTPYTGFNITNHSTPESVGSIAGGSSPFTTAGRISDVALYSTALSDGRIAAHYAAM